MAITMYALINVETQEKITEARETTHLNNGQEAWLPIVYKDRPEGLPDNKTADRVEKLDGATWLKDWEVRQKTAAELRAEKQAEVRSDKAALVGDLPDILEALLSDDATKKNQILARVRKIKSKQAD